MNLSLFPELDPPNVKPAQRSSPRLRPAPVLASHSSTHRHPLLWLCLRFPHLTLQALSPPSDEPALVVEGEGSMAIVVACNDVAVQVGIEAGMSLSSALACVDAPRLLRRDPARESDCLAAIADASVVFTDRVSLIPGEGVLLEIRGSLKLFGGIRPLCEQVIERVQSLGHEPAWAVAPTPLAALWLARAGSSSVVESKEALPGALGRLSLSCLSLSERVLENLQGIGVRQLDALLRLPRDGLSRRWGPGLRKQMDQALGQAPDPRPCWRGALRFQAYRELAMETANAEWLLRAAGAMIESLLVFLRRHDSRIEQLTLICHHHSHDDTRVVLGLLGITRQVEALVALLSIRLESIRLPANVIALSLVSSTLRRFEGQSCSLLPEAGDDSRQRDLLDRLGARFGVGELFGIAARARHAPEGSWRRISPGQGKTDYQRCDRPLWLLSQPRPIDGKTRLHPVAGPERIETGWWEGRDITRDYYRVRSDEGTQLWVFRDRRNRQWFLHGYFG